MAASEPSTPIARGAPAYRAFAVALLTAGFATFFLLYSVQPLLPLFTHDFGISAAESSLAVSFATGPMAVALLFAGVLSDRIGRRPIMLWSLISAAALTLVSGLLPGWHALLAMRLLTGIALAGVPAVAMAYVAEEVEPDAIGSAMGLYIAGTAIGGMSGRLGVSLLAEYMSWRIALVALGAAGLAAALTFGALAPPSRRFVPRRHDRASFGAGLARLLGDAALPWLYAEAFLLMGAFITIYNYAGFRLLAPPYALSHGAVGAIFLLYIVGSFSSAWVGGLAGRLGRRRVLWMPIMVLLVGVALTVAAPLWLIITGIGVATAGFFGAHSVASSWVGRRALGDRGQGASLYLFFYYLGSSLLGAAGGFAWAGDGWRGVALFAGALTLAALLIAWRLARVAPLPENMPRSEPDALPPG